MSQHPYRYRPHRRRPIPPGIYDDRKAQSEETDKAFEPPKYLSSLISSINDGAKSAQTGAFFFTFIGLYLLAVAFSTTDEDLLRERTIAVSQIGVAVPVLFSFAVAPIIFVFLHVQTLFRYDMLAANLTQFEAELSKLADESERERCRHLLANVEFLRGTGAKRGSPLTSRLFRLMSWFMLAGFPLLVLTIIQLSALRYQDIGIIWAQRGALVADAGLLVWFFRRLSRLQNHPDVTWKRQLRGLLRRDVASIGLLLLIAFNLAFMGVPSPDAKTVGHQAMETRRKELKFSYKGGTKDENGTYRFGTESNPWSYTKELVANGLDQPIDRRLCLMNFGCRYLRVPYTRLLAEPGDAKALANLRDEGVPADADLHAIEGLNLRHRTLRFVDLEESRLYAAALTGADAEGAYLVRTTLKGADLRANLKDAFLEYSELQGANLERAQLPGAHLAQAQLQGANLRYSELEGANLERAQLSGAYLAQAQLQGANLNGAKLQEADLSRAELRGAHLHSAQMKNATLWKAELQGADLGRALLQGANLFNAKLRGADLFDAQLQGADLYSAELQGANLTDAQLWGANLENAQLQGANLTYARLRGADLSYAKLQGADLRSAKLQGADLRGTKLQGADLRNAQLQGTDLRSADLWQARLDEKTDLSFADVRGADFIAVTDEQRVEILESLQSIPNDERRNQAIRQVEAALTQTGSSTRQLSPVAKQGTVLIEPAQAQTWNSLNPKSLLTDEAAYDAKLASYLLELAKSDADVAQGIARRVVNGSGNEQDRALYPTLARLLLAAREKGEVKLPDDIAEKLKTIAARAKTPKAPAKPD